MVPESIDLTQWETCHSPVELIYKGQLHEKSEEIRVIYLFLWVVQ